MQPRTRRYFYHGTMKLADPNPEFTPEQVKTFYATSYPDLANATIHTKGEEVAGNGNKTVNYEFKRAVGTKG
jgi:PRTRC genetic system protein C